MTAYVDSALFLRSAATAPIRRQVASFSADVAIESMEITEFLDRDPPDRLTFHHLALYAPTSRIRPVIECAIATGAGIG